jgi:hypothetical protein
LASDWQRFREFHFTHSDLLVETADYTPMTNASPWGNVLPWVGSAAEMENVGP